MSRLTPNFMPYARKENYSMDIKRLKRSTLYISPFAKKKQDSRIINRDKTPINVLCTQPDKKQLIHKKRRLSLSKNLNNAPKNNNLFHSVNFDEHLTQEKLERVAKFINQNQYQQAISILKTLLNMPAFEKKKQVFEMLLYSLKQNKNYKEVEQYLTKYITEFGEQYTPLIERGKVRLRLGAKELALRDFKSAVFVSPHKHEGYELISTVFEELNRSKEGYEVLKQGIAKANKPQLLQIKLVEIMLKNKTLNEMELKKISQMMRELIKGKQLSRHKGEILFLQGRLQQYKGNHEEACIYYEESLKYNSSKDSVTKSMERILILKINERDYYEAYHTVKRDTLLRVHQSIINPYSTFLEGVIMIMKKKFGEGVSLLQQLQTKIPKKLSEQCKTLLQPLIYKHLAYGYFRLGSHEKVIAHYKKLKSWGYDESSSYNLLLAEGIIAVQKHENYQMGIQKFQQAKFIYPCKVEPHLYISMAIIYRAIRKLKKQNQHDEEFISAIIHGLDELNEAYEQVSDVSSNLLYHRSIIHFYLSNWEEALEDINRCIEKAEQNLPKYFYLRGLAYAILRNFNKAINEYSISLSLSIDYHKSLLQRAKCYFLTGDTDNGFSDLKKYLNAKPDDFFVHIWIGNLLYEGKSYTDALKAYDEVEGENLQALIMRCKCLARVSKLQNIKECLTRASKLGNCKHDMIQVDMIVLGILQSLIRQNFRDLSKEVKQLNLLMEKNALGYVFKLIDCMNVLAMAMFYMGRYEDAYQSLLLVIQLYYPLSEKHKSELRSDCSEESLSLHSNEIYGNLFLTMIGMKDYDKAIKFLQEEYCQIISEESSHKAALKILDNYNKKEGMTVVFPPDLTKNQHIKLKQVEFKMKNIKIKCKYTWSPFHEASDDLYSDKVAKDILMDLKPSYIDDLPEGPWIKRNQHGVIFTGKILSGQQSITLLSSPKQKKQSSHKSQVGSENESVSSEGQLEQKKKDLKRLMMLDPRIQNKINNFLNKN